LVLDKDVPAEKTMLIPSAEAVAIHRRRLVRFEQNGVIPSSSPRREKTHGHYYGFCLAGVLDFIRHKENVKLHL